MDGNQTDEGREGDPQAAGWKGVASGENGSGVGVVVLASRLPLQLAPLR